MLKLLLSDAPANGEQLIHAALAQIHRNPGAPAALRAVALEKIVIGAHHPVYELDVDPATGKVSPATLRRNGSRYLIKASGKVIGAGHVTTDSEGGSAHQFSHITFSPIVHSFEEAIHAAEQLRLEGDYTLALLGVSAIHLQALMLKPRAGGESEIIMPLSPLPGVIKPGVYNLVHFCKAIAPAAHAAFEAADTLEPVSERQRPAP